MAKERKTNVAALDIEAIPGNSADRPYTGVELPEFLLQMAIAVPINSDSVITQVIDNVIGHFDTLRRQLEVANRKDDMLDVREAGDTVGSLLLAGVEQEVSYDSLVKVINAMKLGNAQRRVALHGVVDAAQ